MSRIRDGVTEATELLEQKWTRSTRRGGQRGCSNSLSSLAPVGLSERVDAGDVASTHADTQSFAEQAVLCSSRLYTAALPGFTSPHESPLPENPKSFTTALIHSVGCWYLMLRFT